MSTLRLKERLIGCRALCSGPEVTLLSRGDELLHYWHGDGRLEVLVRARLGPPWRESLLRRARIARRVVRHGFRSGVQLDAQRYSLATNQGLFELDASARRIEEVATFAPGRRAFALAAVRGLPGYPDGTYWGDYGGNPNKEPMSLWRHGEGGRHEVYTFARGEIDHVHSLVPDPIRGCIWVQTGDFDCGAAIWRAEPDFATLVPVARGEQVFRTCALFPLADGLLYATDTHLQGNHMVKLHERDGAWQPERLRSMAGTCLSGAQFGSLFAFSTTVEKAPDLGLGPLDLLDPRIAPGIVRRACDLVIGTPDGGFEVALTWPSDWLPKGLFGYSTIELPSTWGAVPVLVATGIGLSGRDEVTFVFDIVP